MKNTHNTKRKGFTIVELVIVIAVIAILAAVMIPTFGSIIETANRSADTQLVAQINTILFVEDTLGGGVNDAVEIQKVIRDNGLDLKTKTKGLYIWYDIENKKAVLAGLDENGIVIEGDNAPVAPKGQFTEATSPESFVNGYLFLSTDSADGLANAIHDLRNPAGNNADEIKVSLNESLEAIKEINEAVHGKLSTFMATTAVMTEAATGYAGSNSGAINRVLVSSEMKRVTDNSLAGIGALSNVIVVDFHSGITEIENVDTIIDTLSDIYFIYNNEEIKAIDDANGGLENNLVPINDRGNYIKKVLVELVIDGVKQGNPTQHGNEFAKDNYTFPCNFGYVTKVGDATTSYDFVGHSLYADGSRLFATDLPSYTLTDAERHLIEDGNGEDNGGNLIVYCIYTTATSDFKYGEAYYSSSAMTYMLANNEINSGTITVMTNTATLGSATETNLTISSSVTLHLPYYTGTADSKVYSSDLAAKTGDSINNTNPGNNINKLDIAGHTNLTIAKGVTLNNNGTIYIDAVLYGSSGNPDQCYIRDNCGVLQLANGSTLNTTGTIYAYGVIRGVNDQGDGVNGTGAEGEGEIIATAGTIIEIFTVRDWHGGTMASACIDNNVSPFHDWVIDNIRAKMTLHTGVKYTTFGSVYVSGNNAIDFELINAPNSGSPLFTMEERTIVQKTYKDGYGLAIIQGSIYDNEKTISVSVATADFSKIAMPLPNFDIIIKAGTSLTLSNNLYKVLPGSEILVEEAKDGKEAGNLTINTEVAVFDTYVLNILPVYSNGTELTTGVGVGSLAGLQYKDVLSNVVYTTTSLTANYTYYEKIVILGMGRWSEKGSGTIANCQVMTYEWANLPTSFVVNGNLTFGSGAVFTGDITSEVEGAKITVADNASFTNSKKIAMKNADGSDAGERTVHAFAEGLGITAGAKIELLGQKMPLAHWQPSYAVGVDMTGNFKVDLDFDTIPTGAATYTYNGSIWE